jgi:ribosomal-protein-alanine N-acetyltransferase
MAPLARGVGAAAIGLVQINRDGQLDEHVGDLSELAQQMCSATADMYRRAEAFTPPWVGYLAVCDNEIVGTCAFNTAHFKAPAKNKKAEIAYFTFPEFEGRGFATAMAGSLIEIARVACPDVTVVAQTAPQENVSNRILKKLGFSLTGAVSTPENEEAWEWHLPFGKH